MIKCGSKHYRQVTADWLSRIWQWKTELVQLIYSGVLYLDIKSRFALQFSLPLPKVWQYPQPRGTILLSHDMHLPSILLETDEKKTDFP